MLTTGEFTFREVGKGLCYTGRIHNFQFMYDCGSQNPTHLKNILDRLIKQKRLVSLDLLVISHFDQDHMNGVDHLLKNGIIPQTVVIPYVTASERLMLAIADPDAPPWYLQFLRNPVGYLLEGGVGNIFVIRGGEPDNLDSQLPDFPDLDPDSDHIFRPVFKDPAELRDLEDGDTFYDEYENGKFHFAKHNSVFGLTGLWFFKFFNVKIPAANLAKFHSMIQREGLQSVADILTAIQDRTKLKKLKSIYAGLKISRNNTSLCLFHGPTKSLKIIPFPLFSHKFFFSKPILFGCLLTGDLDLATQYIFSDFEKHYHNLFPKTGTYLLPHHGSSKGWNPMLLPKLPKDCFWVTSAPSNSPKHPHPTVLAHLKNHGLRHVEANELKCWSVFVLIFT